MNRALIRWFEAGRGARTMSCAVSILWLTAACSRDEAPNGATDEATAEGQTAAPLIGDVAGEEPTERVRTRDDACFLLTTDDVARELGKPTTRRDLPKSGQYSAPSCGWFTDDEPDEPKIRAALFLHPNVDGKARFREKLEDVCKEDRRDVSGLGDQAAHCGLLWVNKGSTFFSLGPRRRAVDDAVLERLAKKALPRLP